MFSLCVCTCEKQKKISIMESNRIRILIYLSWAIKTPIIPTLPCLPFVCWDKEKSHLVSLLHFSTEGRTGSPFHLSSSSHRKYGIPSVVLFLSPSFYWFPGIPMCLILMAKKSFFSSTDIDIFKGICGIIIVTNGRRFSIIEIEDGIFDKEQEY